MHRELHRRGPHTSGGTQHERRLGGSGVPRLEQRDPCREKHYGDGGRLHGGESRGVREYLPRRHDHVPGVPPVAQQRRHAISRTPVLDLAAHAHHLARHLESRAVRPGRHGVVQPRPHQEIGEVDPHGLNPDVDVPRPQIGERHRLFHERIRRSVGFDEDGLRETGSHGRVG